LIAIFNLKQGEKYYLQPVILLPAPDLGKRQIERLRPQLYTDMAAFIVNRLVAELDRRELERINLVIKKSTSYNELVRVIEEIRPDFKRRKIGYLELYKLEFRLQKFAKMIAEDD